MSTAPTDDSPAVATHVPRHFSDDVYAVIVGVCFVVVGVGVTWWMGDDLIGWINKPGEWTTSPIELLNDQKSGVSVWLATVVSLATIALMLTGYFKSRGNLTGSLVAFVGLSGLAILATVMAGQAVVKYYNLEYVLWALLIGTAIGNTIGVPRWLQPAVQGEFYIKLGLVLLGMEVLMGKLVVLGLPGILVSWVVTPIVLVATFWFGMKVLRIESPSLAITIAADMSVCGVSAAIATAAACRAKREELSLAISLSLCFTAVMMVVMPIVIRALDLDPIVGGAWMGGTIDSTGAVAAAGSALGDEGLKIATTVKMIQNILIGVIAFSVSIYWATHYTDTQGSPDRAPQSGLMAEVWARFPKFVLGFLLVSLIASVIDWSGPSGATLIKQTIDLVTKETRNWLFCLAFVCIGLEMQARTFLPVLRGGKPLVLYVVGQAFNILLTGLMAWVVFGWLFRDSITK